MKKFFVFIAFTILITSNLKSQNELTYTLGLYETISFGECSATGRYFLQIFNNNKTIFFLESSPSYYGRDENITYTYYVNKPFMELVENIEKPIVSYIYLDSMNNFIDTIFLKAKEILEKYKEAPFRQSIEKRTISSTFENVYLSDTLENIIIGICDFRLVTRDMHWELEFIPEKAIYNSCQNTELLEQQVYNYSSKEYDRQTYEWNIDSTEQTYRLFDKYDKLMQKSISVYNSDKKITGLYSIDKYTTERITYKEKSYPSDLITEEIFYKDGEPDRKNVTKVNEYGDIIKMTQYAKSDYFNEKTLRIAEKNIIKYEYDKNGRKLRYTLFDKENIPLTSVKYIHGKL